jgi:hypothetical protein
MIRFWVLAVVPPVVVAVVLTASPVRAVGPAAAALFEDGRRLLGEGKIGAACARFAESFAIEASSGTLLNLALCHEKLGKTATAWSEYQSASRLAREQGREDRAAVADANAAALEPRLSRLTPVPAKVVPGLVITTEAGTFAEGSFGVAIPVDPGVHELKASAPGYRSWTAIVTVHEPEQQTLNIPELVAMPSLTVVAAPVPATEVLVEAQQPPRYGAARVEQYLVAGGGFLVLGGVAAWVAAYAKFESTKAVCNSPARCSPSAYSDSVSTITTLRGVAVGSWIAGGFLLGASGVLYALRWQRGSPMAVAIDPVNHGLALLAAF